MNWIRRFTATRCITYSHDTATCRKGQILQWQLHSIADEFREQEIHHAEIWISDNGKTTFSRQIPAILHQRLRNIIAG
jgi:hypothetical protein